MSKNNNKHLNNNTTFSVTFNTITYCSTSQLIRTFILIGITKHIVMPIVCLQKSDCGKIKELIEVICLNFEYFTFLHLYEIFKVMFIDKHGLLSYASLNKVNKTRIYIDVSV